MTESRTATQTESRNIVLSVLACLAMMVGSSAQAAGEIKPVMETPAAAGSTEAAPPSSSDMAESTTAEEPSAEKEKPTGPLSPTDKIVLRFMELDLDGTEGVSFEEYMTMVNQRAEDRFKSMDANADEEVSEEEYRNFWQSRKAQWYRIKR